MAIKGKKKSGTRGNQARRRPSGAPRPTHVRREHTPWYRTSGGRVTVAIVAVLLLSAAGGIVAAITSSNNKRDQRRERIEAYTERVRAFGGEIADPATQMSLVPPQVAGDILPQIRRQSTDWIETLKNSRGEAAQLEPPSGFADVSRLFTETVLLYQSAAETYLLATNTRGNTQVALLQKAADQRDRANTIFTSAVGIIDEQRADEGMDASGIGNPAQLGAPPEPAPSPTATPEGN
jgi:hypothetical protein